MMPSREEYESEAQKAAIHRSCSGEQEEHPALRGARISERGRLEHFKTASQEKF